jgi:hypothetical protein
MQIPILSDPDLVSEIVERVPEVRISSLAKQFTVKLSQTKRQGILRKYSYKIGRNAGP